MNRRKFISLSVVPAVLAATTITDPAPAKTTEFINHPVGNMPPVVQQSKAQNYIDIDFDNKMINLRQPKGCSGINANDIYSYTQDVIDDPANLIYELPMSAQTPFQYTFINGWSVNNLDLIQNAAIAIKDDELDVKFSSIVVLGRMPSDCKVMWEIEDGPYGVSPWLGLPNEFLVPCHEDKKIRITAGNDMVDMNMCWGRMHVGVSVL